LFILKIECIVRFLFYTSKDCVKYRYLISLEEDDATFRVLFKKLFPLLSNGIFIPMKGISDGDLRMFDKKFIRSEERRVGKEVGFRQLSLAESKTRDLLA